MKRTTILVSIVVLCMMGIVALFQRADVGVAQPRTCGLAAKNLDELRRQEGLYGTLPREGLRWFSEENERIKAVALVVHGQNLKPSRMDDLSEFLAKNGVASLRVTLPGHGGTAEEMKKVSREIWLDTVFDSYCVAQSFAATQAVPLYFVGYSLGGLLGLDLQNDPSYEDVHFDKAVLLAPASNVRPYTKLVRLLRWAPGMVLKGRGWNENRANQEGTAVAANSALFDSYDALRIHGFSRSHEPTLVFIDPDDELISIGDIMATKSSAGLNWKVVSLDDSGEAHPQRRHHMIVVKSLLRPKTWRIITDEIALHLGLSTRISQKRDNKH